MNKRVTLFLFAVIAIVGCGDKESVQTVDWYKENTAERLAVLKKCKDNPGELTSSPNCMNAKTAANHIALDKRGYQRRTPMNFSRGN